MNQTVVLSQEKKRFSDIFWTFTTTRLYQYNWNITTNDMLYSARKTE
jgi:hypothetical protein